MKRRKPHGHEPAEVPRIRRHGGRRQLYPRGRTAALLAVRHQPDDRDLEREWNLTLLEKGAKAEIAALFERYHLQPNVHFTTWDDYAVMSMVESGLGISILPELILKRVPYRIAIRELDVPALRTIAFCLRDRKNASLAVKRFLEYLDFREEKTAQPCGKTREN